jgi:hypothetical protein
VLLRSVKILSDVERLKVIHELVDELSNPNLREVAVRFVSDEPHRKNVAQGRRDEIWIFADQ